MQFLVKWSNDHLVAIVVILVVGALFFEVGQILVAAIVRRIIAASAKHNLSLHHKDLEKRSNTLVNLSVNIWRTLVIAYVCLGIFTILFPNISLAPLFASAGIIGVAFGFGAQSLVKDFLSGIFIITENQYRIGDVIDIDGSSGTVEKIGIRSTVFRDADGNVHYFPNGQIQHVVNKTMGYGVARITVGVAPSADLDTVITIINETGKKMVDEDKWKSKILETPKFVSVNEFTATNVELVVSGKTPPSDQWSVASELRRRLFEAFEEEKIPLGTTSIAARTKK